jgi:hypothetical protein
MKHTAGFVADGLQRLLRSPWYSDKKAAIEVHVRAKYEPELSTATGYWQRAAVENKIAREIKRQLESLGSPYCLWICR